MKEVKDMLYELLAIAMEEKDDLMNQGLTLKEVEKEMYTLQGKVAAHSQALENVVLLEMMLVAKGGK